MRTGTNYILSIILNNFLDTKVFMNVGGWKHDNFNLTKKNPEYIFENNKLSKNLDYNIGKTINEKL